MYRLTCVTTKSCAVSRLSASAGSSSRSSATWWRTRRRTPLAKITNRTPPRRRQLSLLPPTTQSRASAAHVLCEQDPREHEKSPLARSNRVCISLSQTSKASPKRRSSSWLVMTSPGCPSRRKSARRGRTTCCTRRSPSRICLRRALILTSAVSKACNKINISPPKYILCHRTKL